MLKNSNTSVTLGLVFLVALAQFQIFHQQEMLLRTLTSFVEGQRDLNLFSENLPQGPLVMDESGEFLAVLPEKLLPGSLVVSTRPQETIVFLLAAPFEQSILIIPPTEPTSAEIWNAPVFPIPDFDPVGLIESSPTLADISRVEPVEY